MILTLWLITGLFGFFLMRYTWNLEFGCVPITVGTLAYSLIFMWVPPLTLIAALVIYIFYLFEDNGHSWGVPVIKFMKKPVLNPCKWFNKTSQ